MELGGWLVRLHHGCNVPRSGLAASQRVGTRCNGVATCLCHAWRLCCMLFCIATNLYVCRVGQRRAVEGARRLPRREHAAAGRPASRGGKRGRASPRARPDTCEGTAAQLQHSAHTCSVGVQLGSVHLNGGAVALAISRARGGLTPCAKRDARPGDRWASTSPNDIVAPSSLLAASSVAPTALSSPLTCLRIGLRVWPRNAPTPHAESRTWRTTQTKLGSPWSSSVSRSLWS